MGNQPSKPPGQASSPTSIERSDRRVDRGKSVPAIGGGKATAADPSASHASATAHNISQPPAQPIHEHLQRAHSPELVPPKHADKLTKLASRDLAGGEGPGSMERKILEHRPKEEIPQEPSEPVAVPVPVEKIISHDSARHHPESSAPNFLADYAKLQRPPRLPLPIAEADHAPGSPLLAPVAGGSEDVSIFEEEVADMPRQSSMLSSATVDEDEVGDELSSFLEAGASATVVPTVVEWKQRGEKVYVTGTFANWDKKYKLHRNKDTGGMSVVLQLPPGTHHLKFIVDGEMKASDNLPTAVDYMNVLVNYIEVNADDVKQTRHDAAKPIPGTQTPQMAEQHHPESPEQGPEEQPQSSPEIVEEEIPESDYRQLVPQPLIDIEKDEDGDEYKHAYKIISQTPGPPTLPLFLGRSILNGSLPMKDDSSVLTLPNHTVLNHLATSSIKNGVLATSVTTRYKTKYVTTIMYKPTNLDARQKSTQQSQHQSQKQAKEA